MKIIEMREKNPLIISYSLGMQLARGNMQGNQQYHLPT